MARGWMSWVLIVSGLGLGGSALAQPPAPMSGTMPAAAVGPPPSGPPVPIPIGAPAPLAQPPAGLPCPPGPPCPPPEPPCPPDDACCDPGTNFSIGIDYLLWFHRRPDIPPLATTGSFSDPIPAAIGQRNTRVALDNGSGEEARHGFRLRLGYNFDPENLFAVDGSFFILESGNTRNVLASSGAVGSQVLARPFFNVNLGAQDADPIAVPGVMSGILTVDQPSRLYGADTNLRLNYALDRSLDTRLTFLAGFRWLWLDEKLRIGQESQDLPGLGVVGNHISIRENFNTTNNFYGGQLGMEGESRVGRVVFRAAGKVAFGQTYQEAKLGSTIQIVEGDGTVTRAANRSLLIQPSNAGTFSRERFTVIPEGWADVGFEFNENVRLLVGYNFLFWNKVVRPGGTIDPVINIQALQPFDTVGIARPTPVFNAERFWVHGLSVRVEVVF